MNDILQQLLSMGPGLGAGLSGNGQAMQAFMEGFQRTQQQLGEQRRRDDAVRIAEEDRARLRSHQDKADARSAEVDKQQDFIRSQQAAGGLTETAAGFDDPSQAKSYIESMMPNLMSAFGQESMALGQPAVDQATQVITGRQKKQMADYVEALLKVEHVANNPDADPEITALPAHIAKILGKDSAKLSELQDKAQLPVGKPQGKTRIPAAAGSMEEFSDPATTPERKAAILADRKAYMQSDDRAPKVTVNTGQGAYPPAQQRRIDAIVKGFDSQPVVKSAQTIAEAVSFADGMDPNTKNPADDQALIYAFAKAMDPESVVREGEYATVQKYAQSWAETFGFNAARVFSNTAFLTPDARANMKRTIRAKYQAKKSQYDNVRKEYGRKIERITQKPGGIDELTDFGAAFPADAPAGNQTAAPSTFKVGQKVRNKKTGQMGEVTGVRPDGSPIVRPIQ
jgi:hypothetical protein